MSGFPATMNRYLAHIYVRNFVFMTAALWGVIYLFDTVELLRRAGKQEEVPLALVLQMGILKLPDAGLTVLPFAILFSAMFTFWQLNRRHELIVVRAAGLSAWQFLAPVMSVALLAGIATATVANPFGALLMGRFETLENAWLTHRSSEIALFDEGLWLRQDHEDGYVILHAETVRMPEWRLQNVIALYFSADDRPLRRIDAPSAALEEGMWQFSHAVINNPGLKTEKVPLVALPTQLTAREIEDSFSSPETMSFWRLPSFIRIMESTGFDATPLKVHFQSLLSQPLLYLSMILLAASVSLRPPRVRGTFALIAAGVFIGFATFFLSGFLQALGSSQQIPVLLAAWSPALITLLLGVAAMLDLEDG